MPARLQFSFTTAPAAARRAADDDGPRRLLLLGDFSGHPLEARPPLATRPTRRVDIDNLDATVAKVAPQLVQGGETIAFASLDDFHPDALHARLPRFGALREARAQPAAGGDLLGALLGGTPAAASAASAAPPAAKPGVDALLRQLVAPHVVPDTQAEQRAHTAGVDAAAGDAMRALLHDAAFQRLEAAWRGVQWLVQHLELDETLELHLFDVARDECVADIVASQGRLAETGLHRALADRWRNQPGAAGWSLLVGLERFGGGDADIGLLAALGLIASQAGGPFVADADPALAETPTAAWQALRTSEAAPWLGLAAPRLLLRQPYGAKSDPIAAFAFEELPGGAPVHEHVLWGAGALAVARLFAQGETAGTIDELPAYSYVDADGERALLPCAERFLGEQGAQAWLAAGLMPLASHRHRAALTVPRLQSIAEPPGPLGG